MVRRGERVLKATLRFAFDRATADRVRRGIVSIEDALDDLESRADRSRDSLMRLNEGFEIVGIAGQQLSEIGRAIMGPLRMGAEMYVQSAGRAEAASRRWLDASYKLEKTQFRIGREAAKALLPTLERAAELAETAADFVQEHPGVIRAAVKIGSVVAALGAVGLAVTKGIRLYADIKMAAMAAKQLLASRIMSRAADKQLAAATGMKVGAAAGGAVGGVGGAVRAVGTVALVATSVYIGGEIGIQIADYLGPALYGAEAWDRYRGDQSGWASAFDTLRKSAAAWVGVAAIAQAGMRELVGLPAEKYRRDMANLVLAIGGVGQAADRAKEPIEELATAMDSPYIGQAVEMYIDFQREMVDMDYQYSRERRMFLEQDERERTRMMERHAFQRARTIRDFNRDMLLDLKQFHRDQARSRADFERDQRQDQKRFDRDRARDVEEFAREERRDEEDYYRDRLLRAEEYGIEVRRFEEDHLTRMRHMREDHDESMRGIVADRDAFAAVEEMRRYEKDRRRSEEEAQTDRERRDADWARERALEEKEYTRRRDQRLADFERRLDEDQEMFDEERTLREADFERQMEEEEERFEEQRRLARQQHKQMLDDSEEDFKREQAMMERQAKIELRRMSDQIQEEKRRRTAGFADQLRELDASLLGERSLRNRYYALMTGDLMRWLQSTRASLLADYPPGGTRGSRQMGGYVGTGAYQMHGGEFVLNRQATRMVERLTGGMLTQQSVLSGFTRHSVEMNINVSGLEAASQAAMIAAIIPVARRAAADLFDDVLIRVDQGRG